MGSKKFAGVSFIAYPMDHQPPHIHAAYADIEIIIDLLFEERAVRLSRRRDSVEPTNAKQSDVKHILRIATANFDSLVSLWEEAHP